MLGLAIGLSAYVRMTRDPAGPGDPALPPAAPGSAPSGGAGRRPSPLGACCSSQPSPCSRWLPGRSATSSIPRPSPRSRPSSTPTASRTGTSTRRIRIRRLLPLERDPRADSAAHSPGRLRAGKPDAGRGVHQERAGGWNRNRELRGRAAAARILAGRAREAPRARGVLRGGHGGGDRDVLRLRPAAGAARLRPRAPGGGRGGAGSGGARRGPARRQPRWRPPRIARADRDRLLPAPQLGPDRAPVPASIVELARAVESAVGPGRAAGRGDRISLLGVPRATRLQHPDRRLAREEPWRRRSG